MTEDCSNECKSEKFSFILEELRIVIHSPLALLNACVHNNTI